MSSCLLPPTDAVVGGTIDEAALWNKRNHAQLAVNYRSGRDSTAMEIIEFNVILIDAKKGYIG